LEADLEIDETIGYESSLQSSTHSISSSIVDYIYENGRRYHRYQEGKYMLPNDESLTVSIRLDLYHHLQLLSLRGELFVADIPKKSQRILDCGTGTGIWALDAGEVFPSAEVIGVDLSPIQPEWVVPNVRFEVDDLELDWTYLPNLFDFIHSRNIAQSMKDWPRYLRQMYKHAKPGAYIELAETAMSLNCDDGTYTGSALEDYVTKFQKSLELGGFILPTGDMLKTFAEGAGFVEVQVHYFKHPWGTWPKDPEMKKIGQLMEMTVLTGLESYGMAPLTRYLGMKPEDVLAGCAKSLNEVHTRKVHVYQYNFHVVGRKPEENE
ncbi:S-adenosyl-L-methionine-dependent methyltransferase, partial [Tricharina praecox]|uniref:S-adenosyl-L-methionine-dependent methyltransferase n=1 Tax=Tricharina praecox TaxID=43433 RepID=UPI00221F9D00